MKVFTGIVEEVGKVIQFGSGRLVIAAQDVLEGMEPGGSIGVNGVCLTITSLNTDAFKVDIMLETLRRTNLGLLSTGDRVNLERPLTLGGFLGGHLVQGHIDATGRVASARWDGEAMVAEIEAPPEVRRYIVEKGFIAIDGVSLTVVAKDTRSFEVSIAKYTRQYTTLCALRIGDLVNLEVDIIAKYVEEISETPPTGITIEFLKERGF
ncbi:riboflavin synthase [Chloroflexota bacterium]